MQLRMIPYLLSCRMKPSEIQELYGLSKATYYRRVAFLKKISCPQRKPSLTEEVNAAYNRFVTLNAKLEEQRAKQYELMAKESEKKSQTSETIFTTNGKSA